MNDVDVAIAQMTLTHIAELSLSPELQNLNAFISEIEDSATSLEAAEAASEIRDLALAVAGVQRVALRQLERA